MSHPQEPAGETWSAEFSPIRGRVPNPSLECVLISCGVDRRSTGYLTNPTILVACSRCDWKAGFDRDEATHGSVELLKMVAAPGCSKVGHHWDRCGAYYVNPIDARKGS